MVCKWLAGQMQDGEMKQPMENASCCKNRTDELLLFYNVGRKKRESRRSKAE